MIRGTYNAVLNMWAAGKKTAEIVRESGVPRGTVSRWVADARKSGDARAVNRWGGRVRPRQYDYDAILNMWADGLSGAQIAAKVGCPRGTVHRIVSAARVANDPRATSRPLPAGIRDNPRGVLALPPGTLHDPRIWGRHV